MLLKLYFIVNLIKFLFCYCIIWVKKDISKLDRNKAILKAWQDGFMQSEIAKFLELSDAGVSKILKKLKVKP
jgi:DNA-directed RNA polymerase specialized sigma subunit